MTDRIESEAELIERYLSPLTLGCSGALGLIDDAAVLSVGPGEEMVVTTDAVAAGVHFLPGDQPRDIAWKALAVNVSDLVAKGAEPFAYQMSLSFPEPPRRSWMADFAAGLDEAQAAFGLVLSGGDTDKRPGPLSITITALGRIEKGRAVRRTGGRPGDSLLVTGTLGDGALGLEVRLRSQQSARWGLDAEAEAALLARYLRPCPAMGVAGLIRRNARAAMDISDGLAKDLGRLAKASGTGAVVRLADLPLSDAVGRCLARDPALIETIVSGGDDYVALIAVPPAQLSDALEEARRAALPLFRIGELRAEPGVALLREDGTALLLERTGWDHF